MMCDEVRQQLSLLLYGELSFDQEEAVHAHLGACEACRDALVAEQALHEALETHSMQEPAADLLTSNRRLLSEAIAANPNPKAGWWTRVKDLAAEVLTPRVWRPAAALGLLAIGFASGRIYNERGDTPSALLSAQPVSARVRQVDVDGAGRLQLVVDETRQRVVVGRAEEDGIRQLLLTAASDPSDAGLRGETVEILRAAPPCDETREALMRAMLHDSNDGVRLRALEGLKPYASQDDVRRAIAQVLLADGNSGVRTQAIDVLTQSRAGVNTEIHIVGVFQELMRKESNEYIRMQCQRKLRELKASDEVY